MLNNFGGAKPLPISAYDYIAYIKEIPIKYDKIILILYDIEIKSIYNKLMKILHIIMGVIMLLLSLLV